MYDHDPHHIHKEVRKSVILALVLGFLGLAVGVTFLMWEIVIGSAIVIVGAVIYDIYNWPEWDAYYGEDD